MPHPKVRKACDLCYRKRLKCDAQKPQCSNCALHDAICAFGATRRKAGKRPQTQGEAQDIKALRLQVERLESQLDQALEKVEELQDQVPLRDSHREPFPDILPAMVYDIDFSQRNEVEAFQLRLPQDEQPQADGGLELPPIKETLSAAEFYLDNLNTAIPLFHPGRLLQSIRNCYAHTNLGRRDRTTWAAINVVLALAHQQTPMGEGTRAASAALYLQRAQSVLSEVIMGEADILNVQLLLGMVMLFQGTEDLKPATMLIAIALRLAHELGLHTGKVDHKCFGESHKLERDRVFWIAYILDRDISMRTGQPPVQREADIAIEWPSADPNDAAGSMPGGGLDAKFNFLRCRVQLARIQGHVYDFLAVTGDSAVEDSLRDESIARLNDMLDEWYASIPTCFRPSFVLQTGQPVAHRSFAILYSTQVACRALVYRANPMTLPWMQSLRYFGKTVAQYGHIVPPPLPTSSRRDWEKLVEETRECMRLLWAFKRRDSAFIWLTACTYASGSVCLTANIMFEPCHAKVEDDLSLVNLCVSQIAELTKTSPKQPLKDLQATCQELLDFACVFSLRNDDFAIA